MSMKSIKLEAALFRGSKLSQAGTILLTIMFNMTQLPTNSSLISPRRPA